MTPQELKNSILQLAIQGKLVEQRPEEGTAQELYHQIQAEKRRLIKEGKIKKEKPLPEIAEDEKPFEIPESWMWVRLGEIFQHNTGKALNLTNRAGVSLKYITTSNLYWNRFELSNLKEMFFTDAEIEKCTAQKGDLLVCEGGDIGRAAIWQSDDSIRIQNHIHRLRAYSTICTDFFYYLFYLYKHAGWIGGKGIGIQGLSSKAIHILVFPLPPLAEQKRIVAKIEELLPLVNRYETAWTRLEDFNRRFPEDMKKSILQQVIQGKLVEQRPEEGTAQELYQQIQAEKQRLIKKGKIKKEKPLPEITEDEKPFEIPEGWMWVRLQQIGELSRGRSQKRPRNDPGLFTNGTFPFIQTGDVARANGHISHWTTMYNQEGVAQSRIWPAGTVCLTIAANIGDVAILDFDACFPDSVVGFNAYRPILSNEFFMYGLMCYKTILDKMSRSTTQKNINIDILSQIAFPLPPLVEQKRIVARLEELLPLCERLK